MCARDTPERLVVVTATSKRLAERLRSAWPEEALIVERRAGDRRRDDRRSGQAPRGAASRRRTTLDGGRRAGERRAALVEGQFALRLPARLRPWSRRIVFATRVPVACALEEERATVRDLARLQLGENMAMRSIYARWFHRLNAYANATLDDPRGAVALVQRAFVRTLAEAPSYDFAAQDRFAVRLVEWLHAGADGRIEPVEASDPAGRRVESGIVGERIGWVSDADLLILLRSLPTADRRVVLLRHVFGLEADEIERVLGLDAHQVASAREHGLAALAGLAHDLGRAAACDGSRIAIASVHSLSPVLRARSRALSANSY